MEKLFANIEINRISVAICNTLIHSVWQGVLLALVTGLIMILTRKMKAEFRYRTLVILLLAFTLTVSVTLIKGFANYSINRPSSFGTASDSVELFYSNQPDGVIRKSGIEVFSHDGIRFIQSHAAVISGLWLMILLIKCIRFSVGIWEVNQLKIYRVISSGNFWNDKLKELCRDLDLDIYVTLLQSGIARVPMVIGHLKPVILIPLALMNNLSSSQIEAILLHELSHIKRKDYLVNILQTWLEMIFFFNPAVLWLSQLIKSERENCCDDIVLARTGRKADYINALVACEEYNFNNSKLAVRFSGERNSLLVRVRRIVSRNNQALNRMEKFLLSLSLVAAVIFLIGFSALRVSSAVSANTTNSKRTLSQNEVITKLSNGVHLKKIIGPLTYTFSIVEGEIANLYINNLKVPDDERKKYQWLIVGQNRQEKSVGQIYRSSVQKKRIVSKLNPLTSGFTKLPMPLSGKSADDGTVDILARVLTVQTGGEKQERVAMDSSSKELAQKRAELAVLRKAAATQRRTEARLRADDNALQAKQLRDNIYSDLVSEGLASTKDNLSYTLSKDEFTVNGDKVPDELHEKFVTKYVKNTVWKIHAEYNSIQSDSPSRFSWMVQ